MIIRRNGNIFSYNHEAYAHGVSNLGRMDKGIATSFKELYPSMFIEYKKKCYDLKLKPGDCYFYEDKHLPSVFNLITQENLNSANKEFLKKSIKNMYILSKKNNIKDIAIPEIGCGLGGLEISDLIDSLQVFIDDSKVHITLYSFKQPNI